MKPLPVLLMIFDGFAVNPSKLNNGWYHAKTPYLDQYFAHNPHTVLQASGTAVGLPDGQFGNSEVGHLTLGAGRILEQGLLRIAQAIRDNSLFSHPVWHALLQGSQKLHLIGLVSDGGVHSHISHLLEILPAIVESGVEPIIHMITDGRDAAPKSALTYLEQLEDKFQELNSGQIASISGRYWAMDRAGHFERTEKSWRCLRLGDALIASTPKEAIEAAYSRNETDEFILPTIISPNKKQTSTDTLIQKNDPVLFFNFRSDRARQLCEALTLTNFEYFDRPEECLTRLASFTQYKKDFDFPYIFPPQHPDDVLAQVISDAGLKQFHCAEAEKFPHVTYFFNGSHEHCFAGEEQIKIPSLSVATYDQQPEMSTPKVADRVIEAIKSDEYSFILVNFANGDMVGHTAKQDKICEAIEVMDTQAHRIFETALPRGFRVILTADHGNCDEIIDPVTGSPNTQHSVYPVPFLLMGEENVRLGIGRGLADVAPTVLDLLGLTKPRKMTGRSLILKQSLEF